MVVFFLQPPSGRDPDDGSPRRGPTGTPPDASTLGVKLFLASLSMLFIASMIGYVWVRVPAREWTGYHHDGMHVGVIVSTLLLIACSVTHHRALTAIRGGDARGLLRWTIVTYALALGFLVNQAWTWKLLVDAKGWLSTEEWKTDPNALSAFLFYVLTGLHAAHVVGGFVPLSIVAVKAARGRYDQADHKGVHESALYWHFLDAVWIVIALALLIG
ncbi:MAG: heme-copper oxidase subunit III [Planctomycetes bacterium]|nr:heme-copper oxidase subunit III [Planctomycetota bacterium]MCC7171743.1 heme-copper oxidase subunit III [Planctomycetota bacterium]